GNFTLSNLPLAKDYLLKADAINYPVIYYNDAQSPDDEAYINNSRGNVSDILFIMKKRGVIRGSVKLHDALQPAGPGYWVNVWSSSTQTARCCVTDSQGMYEITGLDERVSDYIISINDSDNFMPSYFNSQATVYHYDDAEKVQPSESISRNIILIEGFSISGKIVDINDQLLPDMMVS
ncbi:hypothetical protein MHK_002864, partial [Candidatus Magnetomorum sp. HK-1]